MTYDEVVAEIEKTEGLIDALYRQAGKARPARLVRFPHLDRGAGGWVVDYAAAGAYRAPLLHLFTGGLNITLASPTPEMVDKKARIQDYLKRAGFSTDVFAGVTLDWYANSEMATAADSLMTFSTSDWMLNPDFSDKPESAPWPHKTLDALKHKIDADPYVWRDDSAHIILAHDHNHLTPTTCALVAHMQDKGMQFMEIAA